MADGQADQMRLQKYMAHCGVASRRHAEELITNGHVSVNGVVTKELGTKVTTTDEVRVRGEIVTPETKRAVILYHKPAGEVCAAYDPEGRPTVLDKFRAYPVRLYPVGRLDWDSEGVLLLTNDGALTEKLLHPRYKVEKTYLARLQGLISHSAIMNLRQGVDIGDGMTAPAKVLLIRTTDTESVLLITIREGRNRQIRRMAEAVGLPVLKLRRVKFATVDLGELERGAWRELTAEEIEKLEGSVG